MVKNVDIRCGMGDITFNMNSNWFHELAESMGWSLKTEYFDCYPDLLARCPHYDEYSFMKMTEDTITTFFNDSQNGIYERDTTLDIVGTIIVAENEPVSICVNVEKTHKTKNGFMVGVKSALDRSRCRQLWNDWFVDAFVVILADETITHAEVEAYRASR